MSWSTYPSPIWYDERGRRRVPQITSGFHERRRVPGSTTVRYYYHSGADLLYPTLAGDPPLGKGGAYTRYRSRAFAHPAGLQCLAVEPGVVDWVGDYHSTGMGLTLRLAGGGVVFYAHLVTGSACVRVGELVAEGQPLAEIGGNPTNAPGLIHLHLEWWPDGDPRHRVDPAPMLRGAARLDAPAGWRATW